MTPLIRDFFRSLETARDGGFTVSVEKGALMTQSFTATEGEPQVLRCAKAFAHVLENIPVFIEPTDLLAGNLASRPGAVELSCLWASWSEAELDALNESGFSVDTADRPRIAAMNDYWRTRSLTARMTSLYDDDRLWPYAQLGVVLPAFRDKAEGWGPGGMLGMGWGIHHEISQIIGVFQFEKVLQRGLDSLIAEARAELGDTRLFSAEAVEKADMLRGVIIALEAINGYALRFSVLAAQMAAAESDPVRRAQLQAMSESCARVPAQPARSLREAMQAFWFTVLMLLPSGVLSFGRFDQFMAPFYERDRAACLIDDDQVLELLQWLRIRDSQIVITSGSTHRKKYGGLAKWHNCVIGGQTADGKDATTPLSYLILQAAKECPTPHPTLTMRVHAGTPQPLMAKALELVGTGIGVPAFISDESCIAFLEAEGVATEVARDYAIAGCLGVNLPGRSRSIAWPMFTAPLVLEFALHGGVDPRSGEQVGPKTKPLAQCADNAEWTAAWQTQMAHFIELQAEFNNVTMLAYAERFPQTVETALSEGLLQSGKNVLGHALPFENGSCLNPIGLINVADSLTAIRSLVFEQKALSAEDLMRALAADWQGEDGQRIHALVAAAPKFGNDIDAADETAAALFDFWVDRTVALTTTYGGRFKPASITIGTSNWPGGAQTGATPDGRHAGEALADESLSPMRGRDTHGLAAVLNSAAKIDQARWQALSLDLRLHPSALATPQAIEGMAATIRDYFARGGKHIQFNVVSDETLRAAQENPEAHAGLLVRIGGCSAFFAQLPRPVQDEIVNRTQFGPVAAPPTVSAA